MDAVAEDPLGRAAAQPADEGVVGALRGNRPGPLAVALDATLVTCTSLPLGVETRGTYTVGMTVADRRPARRCAPSLSQVDVALEVDAVRVLTLLATRVLTA